MASFDVSETKNRLNDSECLVIDSMQGKSDFISMLSGKEWRRIHFKMGDNFGTSSEVWVRIK
jgi:hypothetical protein